MGQRDTWCKHRTAFDEKKFPVCKVGVNYHDFRTASPYNGQLAYMGDTMPCLGENNEAKARCSQFCGWTAEEISAREARVKASIERIGKAIEAIRKVVGGEKASRAGVSGQIPCPTCEKPLHYSVSGYNGHIHARCETPECVSFMQ